MNNDTTATFDIGETTVDRLGFGNASLWRGDYRSTGGRGNRTRGRADGRRFGRHLHRYRRLLRPRCQRTAHRRSDRRPRGRRRRRKPASCATARASGSPTATPDYIRNQVLASRDRLRTETIDLYQFHRPDPDTFEDSVSTFAKLKDEGLVDQVGLSNVSVDQLETAREHVEIATVQNWYNVDDRSSRTSSRSVQTTTSASSLGTHRRRLDLNSRRPHRRDRRRTRRDQTTGRAGVAARAVAGGVADPGTSSPDHLESNLEAREPRFPTRRYSD